MRVSGKVVVVTGAGSGIGAGLAGRFSREGAAAVVVADIDLEAATRVAHEIDGHALPVDVADDDSNRRLIEEVEGTYGPIDLFCANAGIAFKGDEQSPDDDWDRMSGINFKAHVIAARHLIPLWTGRGGGYLLVTASAAGLLSNIGAAQYTVTKHAAVAFAEWISITYGDRGVKVSCLCPQGVRTPMLEQSGKVGELLAGTALSTEEVAAAVVEGLDAERFLILPHPEVADFLLRKATDRDGWIAAMQRLQARLGLSK
jgi:NAD(P)-dependent dehydrogenase (short-subunit alcohol dehydrogenase family)